MLILFFFYIAEKKLVVVVVIVTGFAFACALYTLASFWGVLDMNIFLHCILHF